MPSETTAQPAASETNGRRLSRIIRSLLDTDRWGPGLLAGLAVVCVAPVVALVLVYAADLVPDQRVVDQLTSAVEDRTLGGDDYGPAISGKQLDYFTDCIGITIGLGDRPRDSAWTTAIRNPTLASCSVAVPKLIDAVETGDVTRSWEYFRYWHGYTVVTRPLIALVGLAATRVIVLIGLIATTAGLGRSLQRRHGGLVAIAALAGLVLTTDFLELPRSLPHAIGALAAVGTAWWAHAVVSAAPTTGRIVAVSAASGAVFLFADILTMTPGAWSLLVFVVAAAATRRWSGRPLAARTVAAAGAWIVAWAATWVSKWAIAVAVYGYATVRDTIDYTATNRLDGDFGGFDPSLGASSRINLVAWRDQPLTVPFLLTSIVALAVVLLRRHGDGERFGPVVDRLILMAPAVLPLLWFELLRNHSQTHYWFTYRSVAISAGIVTAALIFPFVRTMKATDPDPSKAPPGEAATGSNTVSDARV